MKLVKSTIFWYVTPCSSVDKSKDVEATHSSETLVPVYQSVRRYISEYSNIYNYSHESFEYHNKINVYFQVWIYLPGVHLKESASH
jgi:hypothetical protein